MKQGLGIGKRRTRCYAVGSDVCRDRLRGWGGVGGGDDIQFPNLEH